jgi:hypothetical protein
VSKRRWVQRILWIDGIAALSAGVLALVLGEFLADLYALPRGLITFIGAVNLAYSACSLTLATRRRRPTSAIIGLAAANGIWASVCAGLAIRFRGDASALGLAVILFEGAFVAALATLEWRHRHTLGTRHP